MKDEFKNLDSNIQQIHMSAIDFKVIALTGLLIDKGLITPKEVEEYKEKLLETIREKNALEYSEERAEKIDECLRYFLCTEQ